MAQYRLGEVEAASAALIWDSEPVALDGGRWRSVCSMTWMSRNTRWTNTPTPNPFPTRRPSQRPGC
mgnify:CR=1 FL=1